MTRKMDRTGHQDVSKEMIGVGRRTRELEAGSPSPERMRTASELGSAIVHQLNGPLTALQLYVGEIRQHSGQFIGTTGTADTLQQIVENAFQETERVCAVVRLIADTFEAPLHEETAVALGRDVISWWSRSRSTEGSEECEPFTAAGRGAAGRRGKARRRRPAQDDRSGKAERGADRSGRGGARKRRTNGSTRSTSSPRARCGYKLVSWQPSRSCAAIYWTLDHLD